MTELESLGDSIRKRMNEMCDLIATGAANDFAEYRKMCGVIEGLALAERDLLDLIEKSQRDK